MAAVGTLTIEMAANVARLSQDMQKATKTVDGAMSKIQRSVDVAKTAIMGLAGVLTVRQFSSFIKSSAAATEQLERMAFLANTSVAEFQRMSLASNRFGISQEKLGDILKDTQDKVGDFLQTGGGAMADFFENIAPKVGVTAEQFKKLSGKDALQLYVSSLEKANLSHENMVFFMEAIASDSTLLLPLLQNNGKAFEEIAIQAEKFGAVMDEQTIAASKELNQNLHSLNDLMKGIGITVYSALLPRLNALLEGTINLGSSINDLSKIIENNRYALMAWAGIFLTPAIIAGVATLIASLAAFKVAILGITAALAANPIALALLAITAAAIPAINAMNNYFVAQKEAKEAQDGFNESSAETARLLRENAKVAKANDDAVAAATRAMEEKKIADDLAKKAAEELKASYEGLIKTLKQDVIKATANLQAEQQGLNKAQEDFLALVSGPEWKQYTASQKMLVTDLFKQKIETEQLIDLEKQRAKAAEDRLKKMLDDEKEFREELKKEDEKLAAEKLKKEEEFFAQQRKQIQEIEDQLTDALMRAFESGKGFGQAFKDTLVNMFRTMVLRPILAPITGAFAGAFGGGGAMAAGAGAGGGAGMGFLGGLNVAASSLGVGIAAGFSNALTLNFAGSLTAAGQLIGSGTMAGISSGLGMAAGTLLPVIGLLAALPSISRALFGGKTRTTGGGLTGSLSPEGVNVVSFETWARSGGLLRRGKSGINYSDIDPTLDKFLNDSVMAISEKTREFARILNLNAEAINGVVHQFTISLDGLNAEQSQEAIANTLNAFGDTLAEEVLGRRGFLRRIGTKKFVRDGETAGEALTRLAISLSTVNQIFDTLNTTLYESSLVGADASSQLLELFGGIEGFVNATTAYYQAFYTEAERTDILTRQLTTTFGQLGLTLPETRDAFRELVEAQDLTTQSGRETFVALMSLSPAFASITLSAEELNQALEERYNLETRLLNLQGDTEALRQREIDAVDETNRSLLELIFAIEGANQALQMAGQETDLAFDAVRRSIESEIARYEQTFDATDAAFSRLQRSVESAAMTAEESINSTYAALNETLNRQLESASIARDAAQENVNALQSVFDLLKSNINDLMTEVLPQMTVAQGRAFIAQALLTAQTTGYLPEQSQLASAISAARSGLSPESFGSAFEMRREQLRLVVQLQRLQNLTGNQLTTAELQLLAADQQVVLTKERIDNAKDQFDLDIRQNRQYYDAILEQTQNQVNALRGVDTSVIGVQSAVGLLETAIQAERNAQTQIFTLQAQLSNAQAQLDALRGINNSIISLNSALGNFSRATQAETQAIAQAAAQATAQPAAQPSSPPPVGGTSTYQPPPGLVIMGPPSPSDSVSPPAALGGSSVAAVVGAVAGGFFGRSSQFGPPSGSETITLSNRSFFAAGGLHSGGIRMVGERGPELEVTGPARYMSNATLASMMNNGNSEEVKQLREENKVQMRALVSLQNRMTKVVEQWNNDGLPNERVEV